MRKKRRILFATENTTLLSGFGQIGHELLTRLHNTNKYEIAEFSTYCKPQDEHVQKALWKVYANAPSGQNKEEERIFKANEVNQFGLWRFDRTLLDFKPDCVISFLDPWMIQYQADSSLREYFHLIWQPTIDSSPIKAHWVYCYSKADAIFTYSEFCQKALEKQGKNKINLIGCVAPGINHEIFKPVLDKKQHRLNMGLSPDLFIVGTLNRNQKRKLFPDLMQVFRKFLDQAPKEIANKSYLYLHTSYPEKNGWDIPELILENGLSSRVLCTYVCKTCRYVFPSIFQDARTICPRCNNLTAIMPNVVLGATNEQLSDIYNLLDAYVQLAIAEAQGRGAIEAAMCGVPIMCNDWTAMTDVVKHCNGYPIRVQRVFRELETGADRSYPDNNHVVELLLKFCEMPIQLRRQKGFQARQGAIKNYNWDNCVKKWMNYIDNLELSGRQGQWDAPPQLFQPQTQIPNNLDNEQFVSFCLTHIANKPEEVYSFKGMTANRDLNFGATFSYGYIADFNRKKLVDQCMGWINNKNNIEKIRCGMVQLPPVDFIEAANRKFQ